MDWSPQWDLRFFEFRAFSFSPSVADHFNFPALEISKNLFPQVVIFIINCEFIFSCNFSFLNYCKFTLNNNFRLLAFSFRFLTLSCAFEHFIEFAHYKCPIIIIISHIQARTCINLKKSFTLTC